MKQENFEESVHNCETLACTSASEMLIKIGQQHKKLYWNHSRLQYDNESFVALVTFIEFDRSQPKIKITLSLPQFLNHHNE